MIDSYLERIRWDGPRLATVETLRALHRRHMLHVPFENLDIHLQRPIVLDEGRLIDKIVGRRRGGFCYELNGAFAALLVGLGFDVSRVSGRVISADGSYGPEFDHMALVVRFADGSRWLADVGFGDSFLEPLSLDTGAVQQGAYAVKRDGETWSMNVLRDGTWSVDYYFTLQPHALAEYAPMCTYHQTSPQSSFTKKRICSRATERGRITLRDDRLIITNDGVKTEIAIRDAEWREILREEFGVVLSPQP